MAVRESVSSAPARAPERTQLDLVLPLAIVALAAALWLWWALSTHMVLEDAYITFRYARNLARGLGFVFNPGEHVLGTTTPLVTLLLAGLGRIFGPDRVPLLARLVLPPFGLAAVLLVYLTVRRFGLGRAAAAAAALLCALHPLLIVTSVGGMETPVVLFLMALGFFLLSHEKSVAATLTAGLLILCRPDGVIWAGLVIAAALWARYRRPLAQGIACVAVLLPWMIFATLYFGSCIPNTVAAKGLVRPGAERLLLAPDYLRARFAWYFSGAGFPADHWMTAVWVPLLLLGLYAAFRRGGGNSACSRSFPCCMP